jgi:hypothetical protein
MGAGSPRAGTYTLRADGLRRGVVIWARMVSVQDLQALGWIGGGWSWRMSATVAVTECESLATLVGCRGSTPKRGGA